MLRPARLTDVCTSPPRLLTGARRLQASCRGGVSRNVSLRVPTLRGAPAHGASVDIALHVHPELGASALARAALAELVSADRTVDIRLSPAGRFVRGMRPVAPEEAAWTPSAEDTVLITGGTRGIGLKLARRIATSGART